MHYILFHKLQESSLKGNMSMEALFHANPLDGLLLNFLQNSSVFPGKPISVILPRAWELKSTDNGSFVNYDSNGLWESFSSVSTDDPVILSNGHTLTRIDYACFQEITTTIDWDLLTIRVDPSLWPHQERIRLTDQNHIVGFRRIYTHSAEPALEPRDWPEHIVVRPSFWNQLLRKNPDSLFSSFLDCCTNSGAKVKHIRMAGRKTELASEQGILEVLRYFNQMRKDENPAREVEYEGRVCGPVLRGENVQIEEGAVLVGPLILCDQAVVKRGAVLRNTVIGPSVTVPEDAHLQHRIVLEGKITEPSETNISMNTSQFSSIYEDDPVFRKWPRFCYIRLGKRIFDIVVSALVIILFLPFFPVIALFIKMTSVGSVFYRARRQGLHGREFDCLKFRTMMVQAESLQDRLRFANQVDGPQFKMTDDPRITGIGKFLRDTYLDELPQFFNVLVGQMSIVGPRPSPEKENDSCPLWRDARLSVRPGITGLWQILRTRQASMDFQEWICYDIDYVRRASFKLDLWIFWKTFEKLIHSILDQFG